MIRFHTTLAATFCLLLLSGGAAQAQNACEVALVGKTYSCEISSIASPTTISTVTMSFMNPVSADVETEFEMHYGAIPYACSCMPSGKPGKVKTPEKSTSFSCIKAWPSPIVNDVAIDGKVAGGGSKIIKGRWLSNAIGTDSYVYACEEME